MDIDTIATFRYIANIQFDECKYDNAIFNSNQYALDTVQTYKSTKYFGLWTSLFGTQLEVPYQGHLDVCIGHKMKLVLFSVFLQWKHKLHYTENLYCTLKATEH